MTESIMAQPQNYGDLIYIDNLDKQSMLQFDVSR